MHIICDNVTVSIVTLHWSSSQDSRLFIATDSLVFRALNDMFINV